MNKFLYSIIDNFTIISILNFILNPQELVHIIFPYIRFLQNLLYRNLIIFLNFRSMLSLGQSKEWPDAMEIMTGQRTFSIEPLKEYFKPLLDWLKEQNKNEYIGWKI